MTDTTTLRRRTRKFDRAMKVAVGIPALAKEARRMAHQELYAALRAHGWHWEDYTWTKITNNVIDQGKT